MKNILTIVFKLTLSCLVAGFVMGSFYIMTSKAKKHNEHVNEEKVMYSLLGYKDAAKVPDSLKLYELYRYVVSGPGGKFIGYLIPAGDGRDAGYSFVSLDLTGKLAGLKEVSLSREKAMDRDSRDKAVKAALGTGKDILYADKTIITCENSSRKAYLVTGRFPGFKNFVSVMLALKPDFSIEGLAVLEHEEDPGLGAEIEKDYFKNQFIDKSFETLRTLDVVKEPIPEKYLKALENRLQKDDTDKIRQQFKDHAIYALTGATISSRSVTNGVRGIVQKFAYRLDILDKVLQEQKIAVPF
jgi:H+/Na+-translocating ferredoxin:NAD+ oxidoreductase subunit G